MKKLVQAKTGLKPWDQALVFRDRFMINSHKLVKHGLHQGCIVLLTKPASMQIFIKGLDGKTSTIEVDSTWLIQWVKVLVEDIVGPPPD